LRQPLKQVGVLGHVLQSYWHSAMQGTVCCVRVLQL
jgi:hypothetical protein